jgi:ADP-dependent NAD(P)H-hydrate dehydratase / NAD(P)H-hydrate epimerase
MSPARIAEAIFRTSGIRTVEARFDGSAPPLMERAGAAAADLAAKLLAGSRLPPLIVAGPGNNGGDGFVAARLLKELGFAPQVVFLGDANRLPADAHAAFEQWQAVGGATLPDFPPEPFGLAVDALFGIGLTRPIEGRAAEFVDRLNNLDCPVLAIDIPSGLDADSGRVLGHAVRADHTITFMALKPGLLTGEGPDHCGEISVHDLALDIGPAEGFTIVRSSFQEHLCRRARASHKGSFGSVGIVGGAQGMAGAALLAGRAALKLGAGRVYVGMLERLVVDPQRLELMLRRADEVFALATVLAVGPGLGRSSAAVDLLRRAIDVQLPLVVDADGLNLLAEHPVLIKHVARREAPTILTPHPAEAGRLLGMATEAVQADRVGAALTLAEQSRALVVLKGCGSVVATTDGPWYINTTGNPGLASAGSGDVLTGMIAALLAQRWSALAATLGGVHLHGAAADALVAAGRGPIGLAAGELIDTGRDVLNRWVADD